MKKVILSMIIFAAIQANGQRFMTKTGGISFSASTPIEKIEGVNKSSACLLDAKSGSIDFILSIKSFVFEKQLMQEHFNENYMESDKFPKSSFKGTVTNLAAINFSKDGEYNAEVAGKLMIHGVAKDVKTNGKIIVKGGKPTLKANFNVLMSDYKIEIPGAVKDKVSKEAKISVNCALEPMK